MRKSQIYGDPAALFLFQAVGINARKSLYQGRFPMIDVARRSDDDRFHNAPRIVAGEPPQDSKSAGTWRPMDSIPPPGTSIPVCFEWVRLFLQRLPGHLPPCSESKL